MSGQRSGNGCLYATIAGGLLLIAAGLAVDVLPRIELPKPPTSIEPTAPPLDPPIAPPNVHPTVPDGTPQVREALPIVWLAERIDPPTPCHLAVWVSRRGEVLQADRALIDCDGTAHFDGSLSSANFEEVPEGDNELSYRVELLGDGVSASTSRGTIERLVTFLVEDLSIPRRWAPIAITPSPPVVTERLRRLATVSQTTGTPPPSVEWARAIGSDPAPSDPACTLVAHALPATEAHRCRLFLRCTGEVLYGAGTSGYADCAANEGRIATAEDLNESSVDNDPRIRLDANAGTLEISDSNANGPWSATFALRSDRRCAAVGAFTGTAFEGDERRTFRLEITGERARIRWVELDGTHVTEDIEELAVDTRCDTGRITLRPNDDSAPDAARYVVWLDPSARSFAGTYFRGDQEVGVFWGVRR